MMKIAFLGDSITAGYGLHHSHSYPCVVKELLKARGIQTDVINEGVSGDTTSDGLHRLPNALKQRPDILVVALGGNDMLRGISPEHVKHNLESIIQGAEASEVRSLLLGMRAGPFYGMNYVEKFNRIYDDLAAKYHLGYLPFFIEDIALRAEFNQADGIHPNARGQRKIAEKVVSFLLDHLFTAPPKGPHQQKEIAAH
jgi:acyl-CoA thioesterase-1